LHSFADKFGAGSLSHFGAAHDHNVFEHWHVSSPYRHSKSVLPQVAPSVGRSAGQTPQAQALDWYA